VVQCTRAIAELCHETDKRRVYNSFLRISDGSTRPLQGSKRAGIVLADARGAGIA